MQSRGKILQKGSTSGRACLIQHNVGNNTMIQPDRLHVLTADIKDKTGVLYILACRAGMSHCLYNMAFRFKSFCKKQFAVPGSSCSNNFQFSSCLSPAVPYIHQRITPNQKRFSFVGGVKGIYNIFLFIHENKLRCRTSGINPKIDAGLFPFFRNRSFYRRQVLPFLKFSFFFFTQKKRDASSLCIHSLLLFCPLKSFFNFCVSMKSFVVRKHAV